MDDSINQRRETGVALSRQRLREKLERKGTKLVAYELAGDPNPDSSRARFIADWLTEKAAEQTAAADAARNAIEREDRGERRADESNSIARSARNASWAAVAMSALALAVAAYAAFREFPISHGRDPRAASASASSRPPAAREPRNPAKTQTGSPR